MTQRKRTDPNRPSWVQQLLVLKADIAAMPEGADRDAATRRAQQLKAAIGMDGWLRPVNRTGTADRSGPQTMRKNGYSFVVMGDRSVGWSIRAISDCGQKEQLVSVYTSRAAADRDLAEATRTAP